MQAHLKFARASQIQKSFHANASKFVDKKYENTTRYKKHRAFVLNRKFCAYSQSPLNIKFGIYSRKDKSKIFIFN